MNTKKFNMKKLRHKARDGWFVDIVAYGIVTLFSLACLIPFIYVLIYSVTPYSVYLKSPTSLIPRAFTLESYRIILNLDLIRTGYFNTLFIVLVSTPLAMILLSITAYPLSKKEFMLRKPLMFLWIVTMFFSGGMIPNYYLIRNLNLINSLWSLILPGLTGAYNIILMRNFISQIPESLEEAALIDGANEIQILFRIVMPLCLPSLAALALFHAVGTWNSYFNAIIYITKRSNWPLQLVLREIVVEHNMNQVNTGGVSEDLTNPFTMKMAAIMVATLPIMCIYPFLQKYFIKGMLVGGVKE